MQLNPQHIIQGCIKQDRNAQRNLYDTYKRDMYTTAYRIMGNFEEANEVTQDCFLKVFKNIHQVQSPKALRAWMKTICTRTALSKIRSRVQFDELNENHEHISMDWVLDMDTDYLHKAIQNLPDNYRVVFTMIEIEGYAHKDVSAELNIPIGTSKSHLARAKKVLREELKMYI